MSRYGGRRSGNDLAYGDDYGYRAGGGGGERWDRDRFERMRTKSRGGYQERDSFKFEEDDYSRRRGGPVDRRDIKLEVDESRTRRGSGRDYNDRYALDDERYEAPRRARPDYLQEDRYKQTSGRELAAYRQPPSRQDRYVERDYYDVPDKKPKRPQFIRRQTSLDFDDRRQRTRYGDEDEQDVNVTVNLRAPDPPSRPEPPRYDYDEQDYRDVAIFRERDRSIYRRRRSKSRSSSSEEEIVVEKPRRKKKEKKAHTVFPKRLANLRAILEFGHPYEEDESFYYVRWNSTQDEINEVLEKSKGYFGRETKTLLIEDSAPPPPEIRVPEPEPEPEFIETTTTKIIENPTDEELARYGRAPSVADRYERPEPVAISRREGKRSLAGSRHSRRSSSESTTTLRQSEVFDKVEALSIRSPSPSRAGRRGRSKSRLRGSEIFVEPEREPGTLVLPPRNKSRNRRNIEEDILKLEREKKAVYYERRAREETEKAEQLRDEEPEYEVVDNKEIRLEKNAAGQMQLERDAPRRSKSKRARRPTQADVRAAMFSLT